MAKIDSGDSTYTMMELAQANPAELAKMTEEMAAQAEAKKECEADTPGPAETLGKQIDDGWESAKEVGQGALETLGGMADSARTSEMEAREAFEGKRDSIVSTGLTEIAEWVQPSVEMLEAVDDTRRGVQDRVREEVDKFDPEAVGEAVEHAVSETEDFTNRVILNVLNTASELDSRAGETHDALAELDLRVRAGASGKGGEVLDVVGKTVAAEVVRNRDSTLAIASALQDTAEYLEESKLVQFTETVAPLTSMASVSTRWAIDAMGSAAESGVEAAENFLESPALLTDDNFDDWMAQIEPGEAKNIAGSLMAGITLGLGFEAETGRELNIERDAENPDHISMTIGGDSSLSASIGKKVFGEGGAVDFGAGFGSEVKFEFDISRPDDKELLHDLLLAQRTGIAPETMLRTAGDHITSTSVEIESVADAGIKLGPGSFDLASAGSLKLSHQNREEGEVHRLEAKIEGGLSFGSSFGTVPQGFIDELAASAPGEDRRQAAEIAAVISNGELGAQMEGGGEFVVGVDAGEDLEVKRAFAETTVEAEINGKKTDLKVEFVVHDLQLLASELGQSIEELVATISEGDIDLPSLYQAATRNGIDASDAFGLKVTQTNTERTEGSFDFSLGPINLNSMSYRSDTNTLLDLGTAIDQETQMREPEPETRIIDKLLGDWIPG